MRYLLRLEAIGDNLHQWRAAFNRSPLEMSESMTRKGFNVTAEVVKVFRLGSQHAWCARIVGLHPVYKFAREFLRPKRDYSEANSTGSRGVYLVYLLEPGLYDVNERISWKHCDRYFLRVLADGTAEEIDRDEAVQCLNDTSAKQS